LNSLLSFAKLVYLNVSFYVLLVVFSSIYVPVMSVLGVAFSLVVSRRVMMRSFRRAVSRYGYIVVRILPFPLIRVRYREFQTTNINEASIFICNHVSSSDPFLIGILPGEYIMVVNIWPLRLPLYGRYARWVGCLSIREMPFKEFEERARRLLDEGVSIIAWPEGTRTRTGEIGQFHGALFRVALATRAPIVPLCFHGNERMPSIGSLVLHPGIIRIHQLPAIRWQEYRHLSHFQLKNRTRDALRAEWLRIEKEKVE